MKSSATIDRIQPTKRPSGSPVGYQEWRLLSFLHWSLPVDALREQVPAELELDLYGETAYVGVVPFLMQHVRPAWCPRSLGFHFPETNLRTYVHHQGRPGVYFFSLEAASRIAVWCARRFWNLPYYHARMTVQSTNSTIEYDSCRANGVRHRSCVRVGEPIDSSDLDSLEFFLLERYLLFVQKAGSLFVGQVHHTPYPAQSAKAIAVDDQLIESAGLGTAAGLPDSTHFSAGVNVEIFPLRPA